MKRAKTTIKFDRNGNVVKITSSAGFTRNNKAAFYLHCNDVQPTFGVKLRRFFRRMFNFIRYQADLIIQEHEENKKRNEAVICPALPESRYEDIRG